MWRPACGGPVALQSRNQSFWADETWNPQTWNSLAVESGERERERGGTMVNICLETNGEKERENNQSSISVSLLSFIISLYIYIYIHRLTYTCMNILIYNLTHIQRRTSQTKSGYIYHIISFIFSSLFDSLALRSRWAMLRLCRASIDAHICRTMSRAAEKKGMGENSDMHTHQTNMLTQWWEFVYLYRQTIFAEVFSVLCFTLYTQKKISTSQSEKRGIWMYH